MGMLKILVAAKVWFIAMIQPGLQYGSGEAVAHT